MSKKQAKVYFFRQEQLPVPLVYLSTPELVRHLHDALQITGAVAFELVQTARLMGMYRQLSQFNERAWQKEWQGLNINAKSSINDWIAHTGMERAYWSRLDIPFQSFIVALTRDQVEAQTEWYRQLRAAAWAAFDQAANAVGNDGRSFKAVVRGRSYLSYRLKEVLSNLEATP